MKVAQPSPTMTIDGNQAAASVAFRTSELAAIYPITPSSTMGELADEWAAANRVTIWGGVPTIVEMQSEGGAIGAVHGGLSAGAICTTFTASQGLLLMIPNMYKIAGELTAFVMHVAARSLAAHALSIFGDHSDIMACRQTGFAILGGTGVQEAHDLAAIALAASLRSRVPFVHFFDGFRTSHELNRVVMLDDDQLRRIIPQQWVDAHRARALTPDHPVLRGTAQNPDTFFQAREAINGFYIALETIVPEEMQRFAQITGRSYAPYEYVGHSDPERVVVLMGSGAATAAQTVRNLAVRGEKVGCVIVRLYRPFIAAQFAAALPASVRRIAVLDRTKEPGAVGEPLYQDVCAALLEIRQTGETQTAAMPIVIGGRYGLSSKEFTPAMVKAVFDELQRPAPRRRFTVGINDDLTHLSLPVDPDFDIESPRTVKAIFFGLGSDGTVGANKNSIKIIGDETQLHAQGYFVYDSKKSGAMTISHLRFGPEPIEAPYLIRRADFIACHQFEFLEKMDVLEAAAEGGVFLLNAPLPPEQVWAAIPREIQQTIIDRKLTVFTIDAAAVAREVGMGSRINTIMQTCFFAISGVMPRDQAIAAIKHAIEKTYARRGAEIVSRNFQAVDRTLSNLHAIPTPQTADSLIHQTGFDSPEMDDFARRVQSVMMAGKGDLLPVSAFPVDGTWPTGTTKWEKRNIASEIPVWQPHICIQCNKCTFVCPHAAIRAKVFDPAVQTAAPDGFLSMPYKAPDLRGMQYTLQVAPEDCTGCGLCVQVCPSKDRQNPKNKAIQMQPQRPLRHRQAVHYKHFLAIPELDRTRITRLDAKSSQFMQPLFEYSGACAGCGETPYIKLLTQLFGDRLIIANATGCSSIYGGNLPTTPYTKNSDGRGPAWSNSLFEDNAEFGLGMRLGVLENGRNARRLLAAMTARLGDTLVNELLDSPQQTEEQIARQRQRVVALRTALKSVDDPRARVLADLADYLVHKIIWIIGGDGWAYDIDYGGLDHVLSLPYDVNVLVLDTEVYSNTGGQSSKSTPIGAAAKFAAAGKSSSKKDLGLMAMSYRHAYVASVAMGAGDNQTVKAITEAATYAGPSLVIAYSHCIAHGYDLRMGLEQQKMAVDSGIWPLYRYDPRLVELGKPPLQLDSAAPRASVRDYMRNETRFAMVEKINSERFHTLSEQAVCDAGRRVALYTELSRIVLPLSTDSSAATNGRKAAPAPAPADPA